MAKPNTGQSILNPDLQYHPAARRHSGSLPPGWVGGIAGGTVGSCLPGEFQVACGGRSGGQKIANPRKLARRARALARYQRRLARCQRGSANRVKAKAKVARAHRKVRASRADFLHRTSTALVRGHDVIVIEDLAVRNMVRNRPLAKAISDCGWDTFRQMIEYKTARAGRHLIVTGRWYPSSQDLLGVRASAH